jgi:hypothetical protein
MNGVYTIFLAKESPNIRSYTVHIYGSGQPTLVYYCIDTCVCNVSQQIYKSCGLIRRYERMCRTGSANSTPQMIKDANLVMSLEAILASLLPIS